MITNKQEIRSMLKEYDWSNAFNFANPTAVRSVITSRNTSLDSIFPDDITLIIDFDESQNYGDNWIR